MRRTIHLHGELSEKYGAQHRLAVATPAEAVRALSILLPGFRGDIIAGNWHIITGDGFALEESDLRFCIGKSDIHFVPEITGSGPVGRAIAGALILGAAFVFAGPAGLAATAFGTVSSGEPIFFPERK